MRTMLRPLSRCGRPAALLRRALPTAARGGGEQHQIRRATLSIPDQLRIDAHPRAWAIWRSIDRNRDLYASHAELRQMCRKMDSTRHADFLLQAMDPEQNGYVTFEAFCRNFHVIQTVRNAARYRHWHRTFGLGVAGNVAGHMEQAGEGTAGQAAEHPGTPAAVFTFYAPHPNTVDATEGEILARLQQFPVTNAVIDFPRLAGAGNVQVEPEMGLYVDVVYSQDESRVERLIPRRIAAFNDCSIRKLEGSVKLSEKKNWGAGSKGISLKSFRVKSMSPGTLADHLTLVSYLKRGKEVHQYSVNAPARTYLMFHEPLMEWIIDRINNQVPEDKWEAIFPKLVESDFPTSMWIALGAGEYTQWGATNFLERLDELVVVVYDERAYPEGPEQSVVDALFEDHDAPEGLIYLHQTVV